MFAVIKTGGKQYRVAQDDVIKVEKLDGAPGESITFDDVLMVGGGTDTLIGAPTVDGASVVGEVVDQARTRKIIIFKKRRRQNSRRRNGHRQSLTEVRITEILTGGAKPSKTAKAAPKAETAEAAPKSDGESELPVLFDAPEGAADDLKKISGVGPVLEKKLNALGITTYAQVASFTADDIARVDDALSFKGRIERDNWVQQAKDLAAE